MEGQFIVREEVVDMEELLLGIEAFSFLEKEGFPVLKSILTKDENDAVRVASDMGFPVALKIASPDIIHKTEIGGIRVPLNDEGEVKKAFRDLVQIFTSSNPEKRLDGVIVQRLGSGLELIVGTLKDNQFGPVLMFGLGGIFVEAINDVSFRLIPIEASDAKEMIEELEGYRILTSPRWKTINLAIIENFLLKISRFIEKHREVQRMDLNPVFISSLGIAICDARIKIGSA